MNPLSDIGIEKYGLRAFQRRIERIHTIFGHDFRRLYTSIQNRLKITEPLTNPPPWLHFGAIYIMSGYIAQSTYVSTRLVWVY